MPPASKAAAWPARCWIAVAIEFALWREASIANRCANWPGAAPRVVAPLEAGRKAQFAAALRGSHGAFLMTPPIAPVPPPGRPELALGMELADAALAAGVEHVVWSSLENVDDRTGGTLWAPHFTEKA